MLLVCQSTIEFLQTNGDKLLFSRERDAGLWKAVLNEISKRGTYSMNLCRKELAQYFQDIERDPSEKLHQLGGSILERAITEMRDLSLSLGSCVKSRDVCFFNDDKLGLAFYRLFSELGDERFDYVDEWKAQVNGIEARKRDSILGDMNEGPAISTNPSRSRGGNEEDSSAICRLRAKVLKEL